MRAVVRRHHKILRMGAAAESEPAPQSEEEMCLRAKIESLRAALRDAQRQLQHYEMLLRNAQVRERELRAQLPLGK